MARHIELTPEQTREWNEWLAGRPECIRQLVAKYPPELLYRDKSTGKRVCIYSYNEDGTVSVIVSSEYNLVPMTRIVFEVDPAGLEECDFPGPDEKVGLEGNPLMDAFRNILEETIQEVRSDPVLKHQRMVNNVSRN